MCFVVPGKIELFQLSPLAALIMPIVNALGERIKDRPESVIGDWSVGVDPPSVVIFVLVVVLVLERDVPGPTANARP